MKADALLSESSSLALKQHLTGSLAGLRQERESWLYHWRKLAEMFLPRRYKWLISPNQYNRGSPINGMIVDETGVIAARTCASGMMAGLTSPTRPWFRLNIHGFETVDSGPVRLWLSQVEKIMQRVFSGSNFYQALGVAYLDVVIFGSAALIAYEDSDSVVRFYNPCLGEFFFGSSGRFDVDKLYREFTLTISQVEQTFGFENMSESSQQLWKSGGANRAKEIIVCHAIEPNSQIYDAGISPIGYAVAKKFKFREIYWEQNGQNLSYLKMAGYNERPFFGIRWDVTSNEAYGRGPGMDALPAVNQLQIEQRRKAEAIDKIVRPPMVATPAMRNAPNSILPGSINYVADLSGAGFKPAFQLDANGIQMISIDIKEVVGRINSVFFADLFMMISQLETVRTATEIDARREEKLIQLGPVIERFENEVLDPLIDRVFAIMVRRGILPPPPKEISGAPIQIQYISMLAEAQRAADTTALERFVAFGGNIAGAYPDALDKYNFDEIIEEYGESLAVSPKALNDDQKVAQLRAARQKAQAQQAAAQNAVALAQGAQTLSKTDVGGGVNALQAAAGNGTPTSVQ